MIELSIYALVSLYPKLHIHTVLLEFEAIRGAADLDVRYILDSSEPIPTSLPSQDNISSNTLSQRLFC